MQSWLWSADQRKGMTKSRDCYGGCRMWLCGKKRNNKNSKKSRCGVTTNSLASATVAMTMKWKIPNTISKKSNPQIIFPATIFLLKLILKVRSSKIKTFKSQIKHLSCFPIHPIATYENAINSKVCRYTYIYQEVPFDTQLALVQKLASAVLMEGMKI